MPLSGIATSAPPGLPGVASGAGGGCFLGAAVVGAGSARRGAGVGGGGVGSGAVAGGSVVVGSGVVVAGVVVSGVDAVGGSSTGPVSVTGGSGTASSHGSGVPSGAPPLKGVSEHGAPAARPGIVTNPPPAATETAATASAVKQRMRPFGPERIGAGTIRDPLALREPYGMRRPVRRRRKALRARARRPLGAG